MGRADIQAFRCGELPHETPMAEWIKQDSVLALSRRTKIWLYYTRRDSAQLVGYGSWNKGTLDTEEEDGSVGKMKVFTIPRLALHKDFWGKPKQVVSPEEKFSRQIVRHLGPAHWPRTPAPEPWLADVRTGVPVDRDDWHLHRYD